MKNPGIAIVSADFPDFISGYGDYACLLVRHLQNLDPGVCLVTTDAGMIKAPQNSVQVKWRLRDIPSFYAALRQKEVRIINIQYPNELYGKYSLVPHFYAIVFRLLGFTIVTTIHEYSNIHILKRISELVFFVVSNRLIVTSEAERQKIRRVFGPLVRNKARTITIGSNVECTNPKSNHTSNVIVTFGMFYPDRRVEEVIDLMQQIDRRFEGRFVFRFVGGVHTRFQEYYARCRSQAAEKLVRAEWIVNQSMAEVSRSLGDAFAGIVFYNDGVSVRRGSLFALMNHGIPIISNKVDTPVELAGLENRGLFYAQDKTEGFLEVLERLGRDAGFYEECFRNLLFASKEYSFDRVAREYLNVLRPESTVER